MEIRKANKKDVEEMWGIIKSNNPEYPLKQAKKEINEMFSNSLIKPTYLVAEEKNKLVGCGGFSRSWADMNIVNVFWINILQECQGKKIGTKLICNIIKKIEMLKKPVVKMIVLSTNKPRFWEKFGFKKLIKYDGDYVLMGRGLK